MRLTTMRRRRGITLVEVLVAIFIMAIGLLALLTLFPLGALRMGQRSERPHRHRRQRAANLCDAFGIREDPSFMNSNPPAGTQPWNWYLQPPAPPAPYPAFQPAARIGGGYPLFVDPYGVVVNGAAPWAP